MNLRPLTLLGSVVSALLVACSSTPIDTPKTAGPSTPGASKPVAAAPATPTAKTAPAAAPVVLPAHLDPRSPITLQRSIFFDYDEFGIKAEYRAIIERHGRYLASNPSLAIKLEGHADERGSSEYNLALGHKRAEAVLRALKLLGVKDAQMEALSWGEEKPRATGHDEAAWAVNRRVDLQYPRK